MKSQTTLPKSSLSPLLRLTYLLQHKSDSILTQKAGVGLSQVHIMSCLSSSATRSQRHIAFALKQTEANVSRQLRAMKSRGLVSITKSKKDGRQRDVSLTKKGADKYKLATKVLAAQQRALFKLLNQKEIKALQRATDNLLADLDFQAVTKRQLLG